MLNRNEKQSYPYSLYGTGVVKYQNGQFLMNVYDGRYDYSVITNNLTLDQAHACRPHAGQKVAVVVLGETEINTDFGNRPVLFGQATLLPEGTKTPYSHAEQIVFHRTIGALTEFIFFLEQGILKDTEVIFQLVWRHSNSGKLPEKVSSVVSDWFKETDPWKDRSLDLKYINLICEAIGIEQFEMPE